MLTEFYDGPEYEVHITASAKDNLVAPNGFNVTLIENKSDDGTVVQSYNLYSCRFASHDLVPWHLSDQYVRFKVERKILKYDGKTKQIFANHRYFDASPSGKGIEIHIKTESAHEDMLLSCVDNRSHQTLFMPQIQAISLDEALMMVSPYLDNSEKIYVESVVYDTNPTMDEEWLMAVVNDHNMYMKEAINEARKGLSEGGIPIGCVIVKDGIVVGRGHNRRIQEGSAILHAEMDAIESIGRKPASYYKDTVLYTTLSPCSMCSGAILHYNIPCVVIGEDDTFKGEEDLLRSRGILVEVLHNITCRELLQDFVRSDQKLWQEDISQD
jgi:creatinine deaminase